MKQIIKFVLLLMCSSMLAQTNLLDTSTWAAGTGSVLGFNMYGTNGENSRELGVNPHGSSEILWKVLPDSDGSSNYSGGWHSDYINIDYTKTYRFTSWVKKTNSNDGIIYLASFCTDDIGNYTSLNLDGTSNGAPYYFGGDTPGLNQWYLLVGYIHDSNYSTQVSIGGVYDVNGAKLSNMEDYKFSSNATRFKLRNYLYQNINTSDELFTYGPTLYEVNGQEPTIQALIDGPPDTQAPTASTLSSTAQTDSSVALSWTAATDDTAVTGYKVYKGAVLETTLGNVLSYQVTGLTASTAYNFTVTALDAAGNESVASNTVGITTNNAIVGNLLDTSTWALGTGSATGFNRTGADSENIREMGTGPHGTSVLLWKTIPGTTGNSGAGGWSSDYQNIDISKTYRFAVWIKKMNSFDGATYFRARAEDASGNIVVNKLDGSPNVNPYFWAGDPATLDKWYLLVGYMHHNSYSNTVSIGGIYDGVTGTKVSDITDFKFHSTATKIYHSIWLSSNTNGADSQFYYDPTMYIVNGQEPTVQELIDGPPDTQAPTASTLSSIAQTGTTADLSWTAATDNTAVTGYKVYKDAVLETTLGNVLSYQVTGLTAATAYNFTVTALDAAGNESVVSNTLSITTNAQTDTQAPTASILSSNAQTDTSVALSWTAATDNTAVTSYKVYKNTVLETTLGNVLNCQVTGLTASTSYNFTVTALDAAGNESVVSNSVGTTTNNAINGNLLDSSTWTIGTGSVTGFTRTGTDAENIREMGIGPHSSSVLLWKAITDGALNDDGGWKTDTNIDPSKTYRFTVWIKKMNSNDGNVYFGISSRDALNDWSLYHLDGGVGTWSSFYTSDLATLDKWYLLVGYVHQSAYTNTIDIGGVYDGITGTKVLDMQDYKFQPDAVKVVTWPMMELGGNTADSQFFYDPTIYEVNGQEPTIQELIDGPPDTQVPNAPTLSSTVQTDTTADLSWTAATDNTAVTGYKVYKDAVLETTLGNVLSYQVTGLTASTAYNFTVIALDAAGNESVVSNTLNMTTNSTSSFDPAYQAILNEATAQGYTLPGSSDQTIQNTKVVSAKASGVWDLADYILVFTETSSKEFKMINWKNPTQKAIPYQGSSVISDLVPLLDSSTGISSDGSRYLSLYNPSQGGFNYTLNNAGTYINVVNASINYFVIAANLGTTNGSLKMYQENVSSTQKLNGDNVVQDMTGTGLKGISRNSLTDVIFSNSTTINTISNASTSIQNESISLWGAQWATNEAWNRGDSKIGYVVIGADMSDKLAAIKTAFESIISDTQAPTASTLSSTSQTDTTVDLSWTAATDNTAVTGYKVYKDAVLETTLGNVSSYQVTGLVAATAYNFTVTALDGAGNESVVSNTLAITTNVQTDTQAPTASTLSSSVQTDTTADLSWTAATDNTAVTGYKVYKDAILETTLGNVLSYQVTGLTASTAYNFTVTALDAAGNESVASNILVITTNTTSGGGSGNWTLNNQNVYYNTGNVGIGTTTPDEKLAVNGNIHSKEVRVDLDGWSDFVFEKDYRLPSLKEVEDHIKAKGHLKDIPSAKNVEENGILLGDMNAKLLQKIEELTLYILQQQKELDFHNKENTKLKNRLSKLEKLVENIKE